MGKVPWGYNPYDSNIGPCEILTFIEEQDSIRMKYRKALFDNQSVES